jgi:hypothetical protein
MHSCKVFQYVDPPSTGVAVREMASGGEGVCSSSLVLATCHSVDGVFGDGRRSGGEGEHAAGRSEKGSDTVSVSLSRMRQPHESFVSAPGSGVGESGRKSGSSMRSRVLTGTFCIFFHTSDVQINMDKRSVCGISIPCKSQPHMASPMRKEATQPQRTFRPVIGCRRHHISHAI